MVISQEYELDRSSVVKNPAMGWVVYLDQFSHCNGFPDAGEFFRSIDDVLAYASILYLRIPWSEVEPQKGRYAWDYDENFIRIIEMALKYGLKLAFRIYIDGKDSYRQATPDFVRSDGCAGYETNPGNGEENSFWTPYLTDLVFRKHLEEFISDFAKRFDDPDCVDFIDAQGLGWWGEMHNVDYLSDKERIDVYDWICSTYEENFKKVLLGLQYGENSFPYEIQEKYLERGWILRRDSFGSPQYMKQHDKELIRVWSRNNAVFAENCYHHMVSRADWWKSDGFDTIEECFDSVMEDALYCCSNTLDLRVVEDANIWFQKGLHHVKKFASVCGYRLGITKYSYDLDTGLLTHCWENAGIGVLPNKALNWNSKYQIAFALIEDDDEVLATYSDSRIEIGHIKGSDASYFVTPLKDIWPSLIAGYEVGDYKLGVAIVDKANKDTPVIKLVTKSETHKNGWVIL